MKELNKTCIQYYISMYLPLLILMISITVNISDNMGILFKYKCDEVEFSYFSFAFCFVDFIVCCFSYHPHKIQRELHYNK